MTTVGKGVCYTPFPRGGTCHSMQGHSGQHQGWSGGAGGQREPGGNVDRSLYHGFHVKERTKQGQTI